MDDLLPRDHYTLTLRQQGWKYLDKGLFSEVFEHPDHDYVLKVSGRGDARPGDDGWLHFANLAMNNFLGNPHVPVIHSIERPDASFYVAKMERLEPFVDGFSNRQYREIALQVLQRGSDLEDVDIQSVDDAVLAHLAISLRSQSAGYKIDLHDRNVMRRANVLVITDPYSFPPSE